MYVPCVLLLQNKAFYCIGCKRLILGITGQLTNVSDEHLHCSAATNTCPEIPTVFLSKALKSAELAAAGYGVVPRLALP